MRYAELLRRSTCGQTALTPRLLDDFVVRRAIFRSAAELDAARFGGRDAFRLPLMDKLPLGLRHIREQLQNDVRDQRSNQIASLPRIQKRHIEHHNIHLLLFCQQAPLLQNIIIISSQPVDALNHESVGRF